MENSNEIASLPAKDRPGAVVTKHIGNMAELSNTGKQLNKNLTDTTEETSVAVSGLKDEITKSSRSGGVWNNLKQIFNKISGKDEVGTSIDNVEDKLKKMNKLMVKRSKVLSSQAHEVEIAKANTLGGPLEVSDKMTQSLSQQKINKI